jgi:hypothetical protein
MDLPNLVNCLDLKEGQRSDCYLASGSDRAGYVVYQNYRGCLNSWLAVPGFMLLPTWGLASKHVRTHMRKCFDPDALHLTIRDNLELQLLNAVGVVDREANCS